MGEEGRDRPPALKAAQGQKTNWTNNPTEQAKPQPHHGTCRAGLTHTRVHTHTPRYLQSRAYSHMRVHTYTHHSTCGAGLTHTSMHTHTHTHHGTCGAGLTHTCVHTHTHTTGPTEQGLLTHSYIHIHTHHGTCRAGLIHTCVYTHTHIVGFGGSTLSSNHFPRKTHGNNFTQLSLI